MILIDNCKIAASICFRCLLMCVLMLDEQVFILSACSKRSFCITVPDILVITPANLIFKNPRNREENHRTCLPQRPAFSDTEQARKGKERLEDDVAWLEDLNKNNQNSQYLHFFSPRLTSTSA